MSATLPAGTRVTVTVPQCAGVVVPMFATRRAVRVWHGTVTGPVNYEPGMTHVRPDGQTQAVRVLSEYLAAEVLYHSFGPDGFCSAGCQRCAYLGIAP